MQKNDLKDVSYRKISMTGIFNSFFTIHLLWIILFKEKMKLLKLIFFFLFLLNVTTLAAQAQPFHYFDHQTLTDIQGQVLNITVEEVYGKRSEFMMLSVQSDDQWGLWGRCLTL